MNFPSGLSDSDRLTFQTVWAQSLDELIFAVRCGQLPGALFDDFIGTLMDPAAPGRTSWTTSADLPPVARLAAQRLEYMRRPNLVIERRGPELCALSDDFCEMSVIEGWLR